MYSRGGEKSSTARQSRKNRAGMSQFFADFADYSSGLLRFLEIEGHRRRQFHEGYALQTQHHTPLPSEDVRRGRLTHTLSPFWPKLHHTLPRKNWESRRPKNGRHEPPRAYANLLIRFTVKETQGSV